MSSRTISTILNLKDNFSNTINKVTSNTKQFQRQVQAAENQAKRMRENIGSSFAGVAAKASAVIGGVGLAAFAKSSLMLASDLNEVQNVVSTTFGDMTSKIDDFAKTTSSKFGMSELQAKKFSGVLGAMMKSSGIAGNELADMTTNLAGLAGDMASFYNLEPDEAFEKLKSAIGGETEPMKALGVNMSVANMQAYALTQGINKQWNEMSQAEQTILRYKYIMQATKDAQGDYAKTSQGFANQLRTLKLNFQTLGANIMSYAIPSFEGLFNKINAFITKIDVKPTMDRISAALSNMSKFITQLGKNMTWTLPIIAGVVSGFIAFLEITKVITIVKDLSKTIMGVGSLLNPVTLVAAGIGLLVAGMITAYKNSSTFREKIDGLLSKFQGFGDFLGQVLPPLIEKVNLFLIDKLCPALQVIGDYVENVAEPAVENFVQAFVNLASTVWQSIQPAFDWIVKNVTPVAWQAIADAIADILDTATNVCNFITGNWGAIEPIALTIAAGILEWKLALIGVEYWTNAVSIATAAWSTITEIITAVREGTTLWTAAQWALNIAMDANPIGVVIIALTALGAAIYEVVQHWQEICEWVEKAWNWLNTWNGTDVADKEVNITGNAQNADMVDADTPTFDVGYNATGTQFWKGGPTVVGEHGPEVVNLPSGSKVSTASQTSKALNNSGHTFNIYITGNVGTEEFFDQAGEHIVNKINLALANV